MYMIPQDWLEIVRNEYLRDFVRRGGATVKFVVPVEGVGADDLVRGLRGAADEEGFAFASVDAESTKIHMIDKVFCEVARQVDWDELAYSFVSNLFAENRYKVPTSRNEFDVRTVARLNDLAESQVRIDFRQWLTQRLYRAYSLCQEFRIAMMRLCVAQLDPADVAEILNDSIKEWLRGELRFISAVKDALIFQRIGRHNARHMLFSLAHWLHLAGRSGLLLTLDISRYAVARRPSEPDGSLYYSRSAVWDVYEVLRQFIDATDELDYCLVVVIAAPEFLADERRGLNMYHALRTRIADEVRDRHRPNPLSSLIRLSHASGAAARTQ